MKKILLFLFVLSFLSLEAQKAPLDKRSFRPGAVGQVVTTLQDGSVGRKYNAIQDFVTSRNEAYQIGDMVLYNGEIYECLLQTTSVPDAAFSTPPGPPWKPRFDDRCLKHITATAHGITTAELQPIFRLSSAYVSTLPANAFLPPIGLVAEVISADELVIVSCGDIADGRVDGHYYWEDNAITQSPNRDTIIPLFSVSEGIANVMFDNVYDVGEGISTVATDETIDGDGSPLNPLSAPRYTPNIKPYIVDIGTVFNNDIDIEVNGAPATFTDMVNVVDNGGGSLSLTGTAGAASNEEISVGGELKITIKTDPSTRPGTNNAITVGISKTNTSSSRFTGDYELYFGGGQAVQIYKNGTGLTTAPETYALNDVFYIRVEATRIVFYKGAVAFHTINDQQSPVPITLEAAISTLFDRVEESVIIHHTDFDSPVTLGKSAEYIPISRALASCRLSEATFISTTDAIGSTLFNFRIMLRRKDGTEVALFNSGYPENSRFKNKKAQSSGGEVLSLGDLIYLETTVLPNTTVPNGFSAIITFTNE